MTGTVVRIEDATKSYEGQAEPAIMDVALDIEQGEFYSLLGPSGSGKTTTLRLIAGFERPDTGRVWLDEVDVTDTPPFERDVNTVFQTYALFPHMTVEQNVAYPLRMKKVGREDTRRRVAEEIGRVGMEGFEKRLPHQLSGGQRQRIALARALVSRPKVVLLDEPLGALDLKLRQQMQILLKNLQREVGITFVYVTHDQSEALAMSDRLAVMSEGRIEQIGTPNEVYYRPTTPFVADFIGKANVLVGAVESVGRESVLKVGELVLRIPGEPKSGPASAGIRYEAVEVCALEKTPEAGNQLDGVIEESIFLGEGMELVLRVADQTLVARVPARRVARFRRGDRVRVGVDPEDIVILHG